MATVTAYYNENNKTLTNEEVKEYLKTGFSLVPIVLSMGMDTKIQTPIIYPLNKSITQFFKI